MSDGFASRIAAFAAMAALSTAALWASIGPAQAADPNVVVTVTAVPTIVSLSRPTATPPLNTFAAYEVSITNNSTNTKNRVRFTGATNVVGANQTAPFFPPSIGLACVTTNTAQTAIECTVGQLRGGGDSIAFVVIFKTPTAGTQINFPWTAFYGEGSGDSQGASHLDFTSGAAQTALGTPTATEVRTYVPPAGGTFFTGNSGVAGPAGDPFTVTVTVPTFAKAEVVESTDTSPCPFAYTCFGRNTQFTIPGQFDHLTYILRLDALEIKRLKPGTQIGSTRLFYRADATAANPFPQDVEIYLCSITGGPTHGNPCIESRVEYTKKTAPTPDYIGDFQWVIQAVDNGRIRS